MIRISSSSLSEKGEMGEVDGSENELLLPLLHSQRPSLPNSTSQVAIVGANVCPIESLDYEIAENDLFKQDWRGRRKIEIIQYMFMKWLLCFLMGIIVSLIGFTNNLAVENLAGIKLVITSNYMLSSRYWIAFLVFTVSNLGLTLFASVITAFISPAATGSGITEVKAYLNGVDAPGIFSLQTLFVKIVGSISASSSSIFIGRAGPIMHAGTCVAFLLSQGGSRKYKLTCRWIRYFKNDRDRRDLVTCGAAAGMASAFRAPVGGVLFAFDEMASWWRSSLLWRSFFSTAVVALVLRYLVQYCSSGKCGIFGEGGLIMFNAYTSSVSFAIKDIPFVILLGVMGGVLGSFYNYLLVSVLRIYNLIYKKGVFYKIFIAALISVFTSCLLFGLPWLIPCRSCPSDSSDPCPTVGRNGSFKRFQCHGDHFNDLASLFFNTNDDAIRNLFSSDSTKDIQYSSLIVFLFTSYFLSILGYGVVAPAGLFVPVILTGASYGRLMGMLVESFSSLSQGLYAVLGAASFLGGSMRMTVSLCIILLELTNNLLLLPLIMLVLLVSKSVADAFNGSIYDLIMKAKGFPYLETHAEPYMRQLTVADVVFGPLRYFHGIETVRDVVHTLRSTKHNGFPVIDQPPHSETPVLYGLILRAHLLVLLKKRAFTATPTRAGDDLLKLFTSEDFAKKGSGKRDTIEELSFTEDEMEMFLDLHPFTNASPYTVVESMSLAKAKTIFRQVGLRHLLVIPKIPSGSPVVGILTRHDFMPEYILGLHPHLKRSKWKRLRIRFPRVFKLF